MITSGEINGMLHPSELLMEEAIDFGFSNGTVGCLIELNGAVIAKEIGTVFSRSYDVTGHSEMNTIRKACSVLRRNELAGCWLYTTYEPCPMCMAAICWAKIEGVVFAASHADRNERWKVDILLPSTELIKYSIHKPIIVQNYLRDKSLKILNL